MKTRKLSDIFQQARQEILDRGWCQLSMSNNQGNVCTVGALCKATNHNTDLQNTIAVDFVTTDFYQSRNFILDNVIDTFVSSWNDAPERTRQDVLDMFDVAASMAMGEDL